MRPPKFLDIVPMVLAAAFVASTAHAQGTDQSCDAGHSMDCVIMAGNYRVGINGATKNLATSASLYRRACTVGNAYGCYMAASMYAGGNGVPKNLTTAASLYQKACDGSGEGYACGTLAAMYAEGNGVPKNLTTAASLYQKGCDQGDPLSCWQIGDDYAKGQVVQQNLAIAASLYKKGCNSGAPDSLHCCASLAAMYETGQGVTQDLAQAAALYKQSCEDGDVAEADKVNHPDWVGYTVSACRGAAPIYAEGRGVPQDLTLASNLWQKGCDAGDPSACSNAQTERDELQNKTQEETAANTAQENEIQPAATSQISSGPPLVTPEVKADILSRLDAAKTYEIPYGLKGSDGAKAAKRICNKGPKRGDPWTQSDACENYIDDQMKLTSATIDQLMPTFKACSASNGTETDCAALMMILYQTGHPDYALAVAIYAPNCDGSCRLLGLPETQFTNTPQGVSLILPLSPGGIPHLTLTNRDDIALLLESSCQKDGSAAGCQYYQQIGGSYTEAEREAASEAAQARQQNGWNAETAKQNHADSSGGFLNSLANTLTQVQQQSGASIDNAAAQAQANLAAIAATAQQRQQPATVAPPANSSSTHTSYGTQQPSYSPPPANPSRSPTSAGVQQGQCTDMTNSVSGRSEVKGTEVIGWLTNNSGQDLYVWFTFAKNGVPSNEMANAEAGPLHAGQTNGGEGAGMYTFSADTNPGRIYWYAVPVAQENANGCVHNW